MLKLPIPAASTQLLGKEFVGEEGRGANLIDIGGGAVQARVLLVVCHCNQMINSGLMEHGLHSKCSLGLFHAWLWSNDAS